jgi:hypothetical protein
MTLLSGTNAAEIASDDEIINAVTSKAVESKIQTSKV